MGVKQRAQARGKGNKAAKGSMKGQSKSQKQLNQSVLVPTLDPIFRSRSLQAWNNPALAPDGHKGFSMSEEARNTDRRTLGWGETPLRSKGIHFVSAGRLKREEDAWNTVSEDDSPQKQSDVEPPSTTAVEGDQKQKIQADVRSERKQEAELAIRGLNQRATVEELPEEAVGVSETSESAVADARPKELDAVAQPENEPASATSSDSEEEIVFAGRTGTRLPMRRPTPAPPPPNKSAPLRSPAATPVQPTTDKIATSTFTAINAIALDSPVDTPVSNGSQAKRSQDKPLARSLFGRKYDEEALMQDYIDNMALDDSEDEPQEPGDETTSSRRKPLRKTETFRMFDGDGLENAKVQTKSNRNQDRAFDVPDQAFDWDSGDLADFDDLSTTDEEVEDVGQVIRHRKRASGVQYLVVASGAEASEAKWMLHSKLISEKAIEEIKIFEEIRQMNVEYDDYDDEDDDDSAEDEDEEALQDLIDNIESEDDENARIMNMTSRMSDEQIARALAKQEELGLGSDELMLFDGEVAGDNDVDGDPFEVGDDFVPFNAGKHISNRTRSKRNKKQRDSFPSAEAFADALDQDPYGAFDIMDFERPSLRSTKKGRKSGYPFEIEGLDDDLRDQLVNTWTRDREKKAARKQEREATRLAANLDAADASDPVVIKAQIRQFLVADTDTLRLSPMEAQVRAAVHRLAKALKLNSRSEGKDGLGLGRFPILTKTPRTPCYSSETVWQTDALMNTRKFFPKHLTREGKTPRSSGTPRPRRGGGGVMSGATYRDGEEVGASAPELGTDNKGRAMLEKMGWTAGMGIGAVGNKGSLDHVRHIVKTTKAGLG